MVFEFVFVTLADVLKLMDAAMDLNICIAKSYF
jgi:hypothetical protein